MKGTIRITLIVLLALVACVATASADTGAQATATPWVYDPDSLGNSSAVWESAGGQNVLDLQKNADTSSNQAAGATVDGFATDPLFQLSFDVRGYCNNGAPRFNVYEGDTTHFFGCALGEQTDLGDGWTHVEFNCTEPGSNCPEEAFITIDGIDIVQDEQGQTELRNISVNDIIVGPPAAAPDVVPEPVTAQQNRDGYCMPNPVHREGDTDGRFVNLFAGQNTQDPTYKGAVPAFQDAVTGAQSCEVPNGYRVTGQTAGSHPLFVKA